MQDYTDIPKLVTFTPRSVPSRNLRSEIDTESESEVLDLNVVPKPGKYYVVLGDNVEGYYIVKCLEGGKEQFHGKYLEVWGHSSAGNRIVVSEMRQNDKFYLRCLVSEILVASEALTRNTTRLTIDKEEMSGILLTIGEMSDS